MSGDIKSLKRDPHAMIPTPDRLEILLSENNGNISAVAKILKCPRLEVYKAIKKSKRLIRVVFDSRETLVDAAEAKLREAVDEGHAWAIKFVLENLGQKRGYGPSGDENAKPGKSRFTLVIKQGTDVATKQIHPKEIIDAKEEAG